MRLVKDGKLDEYDQLFQQWLNTDKIEVVPAEELENNAHYLQHRAVYNPNSKTTPTRPVFNASYRTKGNPALNDCLMKGPNLLELIPTLCTRFRLDKVGVLADITKAFQQISVVPSDRDCSRFLWWSDLSMKRITVFRHRRVVFGVNASPFLLAATLKYVFSSVPESDKEVANQLDKSFYVDNLVTAVSSVEEALELQKTANHILSTVKMELRGWEIGPSSEEKTASLLGMKWNMMQDTIVIEVPDLGESKEVTRRSILSTANSVFDPLGFVSPFMLNFKVLIQETWKEDKHTRKKIGWDTPVSEEVKQKYEKLVVQLPNLNKIEIPRWISSLSRDRSNWSLHVFVDGSKLAYACCAFLRVEFNGEVNVNLLESRTRVVPVGGATVPRTELLSCLIGVRLAAFVKANLEFPDIPTSYYTDSSTALHWISKDDDWGVFVRNRRKQILEYSKINEWRHIPGENNPADLPSRGCTTDYLLKSRWWEGPTWLNKSEEHWPKSAVSVDIEIVESEKKKLVSSMLNCSSVEMKLYEEICNSNTFEEMIFKIGGECGDAEMTLLRLAQKKGFPALKEDKRLQKLEVFEENGILRVKTRLFYSSLEEEFRCPVVLPPECKIVQCLIMKTHMDNCHGRVSFLMTKLRQKYWILKCRRTVRQVLRKCTSCRRFDAKAVQVNTPPLPKERIEATTPFEVTGIDLAGPMFLKNQHKAWMVLFTCAVYRAIHLELVTSLNTPNFKLALRRFVSRRGKPQIIYTDNGTNFVGCSNELDAVDLKKIQESSVGHGIDWRFIPPASPWWGGFWERLVGITKDLLKRTLGQATLNQIELITLLTEVEATVNERPLTYVSEDPDTLIPLTPALFLLGNKSSTIPELDEVDRRGLCKRAKYLQQIREELRGRFKKEYLGQLSNLKQVKDSPRLKVGDVVLVQCDNVKRLNWPMGKISELVPGRDGKVRVVRVRTKDGEMKRSVQRIYPLEINEEGVLDTDNGFKLPKEATILCLDSVVNN